MANDNYHPLKARGRLLSALVTLSGGFGLGMAAMQGFIMPLRAHELGASSVAVGALVGAGALIQTATAIPLGRWTDRIGARRGFALGSGGVVLASVLAWRATDLRGLLIAHLIFGLARGWGWIASQSYMAAQASGHQLLRRSGRFALVSGVAAMIGPAVIGVVAGASSFAQGFLVIGATGSAFAVIALVMPDEQHHAAAGATTVGPVARLPHLLQRRGVLSGLLLSSVDLWIHTVWVAFVPILLLEGGMGPAMISTVVSAKAMGGMLGSLSVRFTDQTPLPRAVIGGCVLAMAGLALAISPLVTTPPWTHILAFLLGTAGGVTTPLSIALVSDAASSQRATALGFRSTSNQLSAALAPVAMGKLMAAVAAPVAFPAAAAVACAAIAIGLAGPLRLPEVTGDSLPEQSEGDR